MLLRRSEKALKGVETGREKTEGDFEGLVRFHSIGAGFSETVHTESAYTTTKCSEMSQRYTVCTYAEMTHHQDLIRPVIPKKIQGFTTHQARRVRAAQNSPRRSRLINHNIFRGMLPLLATSMKIRYPHIESEVIPLCGYMEPRQARRA